MLSDCNQQITTKYAHEDPLVFNEKYGVIQNPRVKVSIVFNHVYVPRLPIVFQRRTGARPPPPPAVVEPAKPTSYRPESKKTETKANKDPERPLSSSTTAKSETKPATQPKTLETKPVDRKPSLLKEKSDIFKSFGKTKVPTAKLRREETDTSAASVTASAREDGSFLQSTLAQSNRYQKLIKAHRAHERRIRIRARRRLHALCHHQHESETKTQRSLEVRT